MRYIMAVMLLCTTTFAKSPLQFATEFEQAIKDDDTRGFEFIKKNTDVAMDRALQVAMAQLRAKGRADLAEQIFYGWSYNYRGSLFTDLRSIGDHKPISVWIATMYEQIEAVLTRPICKSLHISDIKSINSTVLTVINPCTFDMNNVPGTRISEYQKHFSGGPFGGEGWEGYYGLIPVLSFWLADASCYAGGISAPVCPIFASLVEVLTDVGSAYLANGIYKRSCGDN